MLKEYSKSIVHNSMSIDIFLNNINSLLSIAPKNAFPTLKISNTFELNKI